MYSPWLPWQHSCSSRNSLQTCATFVPHFHKHVLQGVRTKNMYNSYQMVLSPEWGAGHKTIVCLHQLSFIASIHVSIQCFWGRLNQLPANLRLNCSVSTSFWATTTLLFCCCADAVHTCWKDSERLEHELDNVP